MADNLRAIYYITNPKNETKILENNIFSLKNRFNDFDFSLVDDRYLFTFKNLNIIISKRGYILLSLISTRGLSQDLSLLSKFADRINFMLGIENYSKKFMI